MIPKMKFLFLILKKIIEEINKKKTPVELEFSLEEKTKYLTKKLIN